MYEVFNLCVCRYPNNRLCRFYDLDTKWTVTCRECVCRHNHYSLYQVIYLTMNEYTELEREEAFLEAREIEDEQHDDLLTYEQDND